MTLAEAKTNLRITHTDHDSMIEDNLIKTAREIVENYAKRQLIEATWTLYLPCFPSSSRTPVDLKRVPVISVETIKYKAVGGAGALTTWDAADYQVDVRSEPGRILPAPNKLWPSIDTDYLNPIEIAFKAGFGTLASSVPEIYKRAMQLAIFHLYRNPGETSDRKKHQIELGLESLAGMDPGRWGFI